MKKEPIKKEFSKKAGQKKILPSRKQVNESRVQKYYKFIGAAIIVILGIIIYSNSFNCAFHYDDGLHIVNNAKIRNIGDVNAWWNYSQRPISMFSFVLNYHFNKLDVWGYHLVNLLIHLITTGLVWWFAFLIFSSPALKEHPVVKNKFLLSFFISLLFLAHPLATQSVTYIMQRQNAMAAMFYFLSIILYMKGRMSDKEIWKKYLLFAGSLIFMILGVFSKENAFTIPLSIILVEFFFLRTRKISINFKDYRVILAIVFLIGLAVLVLSRFSFDMFDIRKPSDIEGRNYTITPLNYLFTEFWVILKYIQLLIFPINQSLDHDIRISNNFFELRTIISFLVLLGLVVWAVFLFKKHRIFSFGIIWFLLTLSIESSIIPLDDFIYEHRTYLPSFGFFLIISIVIYNLLWQKNKNIAISIFVLLVIISSIASHQRNNVWKDDITLWSDVVLKSPGKARPLINRGLAYANLGQLDKALADLSKAADIAPSAYIFWNRGIIYSSIQQWDKAIADYSSLVKIDTGNTDAYFNRAVAYDNSGDHDKAYDDYSKVIKQKPSYLGAFNNRGVINDNRGQLDKAIDDYTHAIWIDSNYSPAYENRANVYKEKGQPFAAIIDYTRAIDKSSQKSARTYFNRGMVYRSLGWWDKALDDFSTASEIDPNFQEAIINRDVAMQFVKSMNQNKQ